VRASETDKRGDRDSLQRLDEATLPSMSYVWVVLCLVLCLIAAYRVKWQTTLELHAKILADNLELTVLHLNLAAI